MNENPKIAISISVDLAAWKFHKAAGHNISKMCSDYLATFVTPETENKQIKVLEEKLAVEHKKVIEQTVIETKNRQQTEATLTEDLLEAKGLRATGGNFGATIDRICEKYNITRSEAVSRMERI